MTKSDWSDKIDYESIKDALREEIVEVMSPGEIDFDAIDPAAMDKIIDNTLQTHLKDALANLEGYIVAYVIENSDILDDIRGLI